MFLLLLSAAVMAKWHSGRIIATDGSHGSTDYYSSSQGSWKMSRMSGNHRCKYNMEDGGTQSQATIKCKQRSDCFAIYLISCTGNDWLLCLTGSQIKSSSSSCVYKKLATGHRRRKATGHKRRRKRLSHLQDLFN